MFEEFPGGLAGDPVSSLKQLGLGGFSLWPGNLQMPQAQSKKNFFFRCMCKNIKKGVPTVAQRDQQHLCSTRT